MADQHPAPWDVRDNAHGGNGVVDADGVLVIGVDDPKQNIEFMDDYARALVLAAPETEDALRKIRTAVINAENPMATVFLLRAIAEKMLARLDEASRG